MTNHELNFLLLSSASLTSFGVGSGLGNDFFDRLDFYFTAMERKDLITIETMIFILSNLPFFHSGGVKSVSFGNVFAFFIEVLV